MAQIVISKRCRRRRSPLLPPVKHDSGKGYRYIHGKTNGFTLKEWKYRANEKSWENSETHTYTHNCDGGRLLPDSAAGHTRADGTRVKHKIVSSSDDALRKTVVIWINLSFFFPASRSLFLFIKKNDLRNTHASRFIYNTDYGAVP